MTKYSTWTALRNPVFRQLWIASVISGTCVAAHLRRKAMEQQIDRKRETYPERSPRGRDDKDGRPLHPNR